MIDLQHHLFVMSLHGALHLAPIKEGVHAALDSGTGTGIWAIEFGIVFHIFLCHNYPFLTNRQL
jgi:hypothetical protein